MNLLIELIKATRELKSNSDTKASPTGGNNSHNAFAKYQDIDLTIDDLHKILDKLENQSIEKLSEDKSDAIQERLDEVLMRIEIIKAIADFKEDGIEPVSFKFLNTGADVKMIHIYVLQSLVPATADFHGYITSKIDITPSQYKTHMEMMKDSEWYNSLNEELLDTALEEIEESLDKGVGPADTKAYAYFLEVEKSSPLF